MSKEKAVLTVTGRDDVGILAKAATCCAEANASVIEMTQSVKQDFFTMMMVISIDNMNCSIDELQTAIQKKLETMDVHVMHENIFNSMHRI
ncbi:MAG: ACT domain-containing protein [Eubacteriales bacterium]|nr:ACT domain-containing protein [Eubacteriales bacterium]